MDAKSNQLQIEGIIELTEPVCFHRDILGKRIKMYLEDLECFIAFPKLPYGFGKKKEARFLVPPRVANVPSHRRQDWGVIQNWPDGYSEVQRILILCSATKGKFKSVGNRLHKLLQDWKWRFEDYLEIQTGQAVRVHKEKPIYVGRGEFQLSVILQGKSESAGTNLEPSKIIMRRITPATKADVLNASRFAADRKVLNPAYELIKKARRDVESREFRTAIIDAATSCEISLQDSLESTLAKKLPENLVSDLLKNKYKTLGPKIRLASLLSIIPKLEYESDLIEPRNKAVHKGTLFSYGEAKRAVEISEKLASGYYKSFSD